MLHKRINSITMWTSSSFLIATTIMVLGVFASIHGRSLKCNPKCTRIFFPVCVKDKFNILYSFTNECVFKYYKCAEEWKGYRFVDYRQCTPNFYGGIKMEFIFNDK